MGRLSKIKKKRKFERLKRLWEHNPAKFCETVLGLKLYGYQKALLNMRICNQRLKEKNNEEI